MTVYIDADGCPVVNITIRCAKQAGADCVIVCDTAHEYNIDGARTITVPRGADSADFVLVNMLKKGDILVTQDYGLAAMSLSRGAAVLNQDGFLYTNDNIDAMLMRRHITKKALRGGHRVKGPSKRTTEQDKAFESKLNELLCIVNN